MSVNTFYVYLIMPSYYYWTLQSQYTISAMCNGQVDCSIVIIMHFFQLGRYRNRILGENVQTPSGQSAGKSFPLVGVVCSMNYVAKASRFASPLALESPERSLITRLYDEDAVG